MKRNGFFSFLAGLGFLLPVLYLFFRIRSLAAVGYPTYAVGILTVQGICMALLALRLLTNRPLNAGFALLALICALTQMLMFLQYRGGFRTSDLFNILAWSLLTLGCILVGVAKTELSSGKKALLFLPAILSLWGAVFELQNGVLRMVLRSFYPARLQSWALLYPLGLAAGFLFFALWAVSGVPSAVETRTRTSVTAPAVRSTAPSAPLGSEDRIVQQYQGFLASGIITRAEFDAKMRSLGRK